MLCKTKGLNSGWLVAPYRMYPALDLSDDFYADTWCTVRSALVNFDKEDNSIPWVMRLHSNQYCESYKVVLPSELM